MRQLGQLVIGAAQFRSGICQRTGFDFQLAGIFQHLRRFVRHSQQILNRDRGPTHQLRHHSMRRSGPHRCCEFAF